MRFIATIIVTTLWVLNSYAQEFGTHWISYPLPNDSCEVLFRKVYHLEETPLQAHITMASTGNIRVYINERNASRSILYEGCKNDTILSRTIDISPMLKKGDNTIAVWYAPNKSQHVSKQLSMELYGWSKDAIPFYHQTDGTWWTKQISGFHCGEKELFDNRRYSNEWKSAEYHPIGWLHPTGACENSHISPYVLHNPTNIENKLHKILYPALTYNDSLGYHVDFGRPFRGTIRITIRGAHKGSVLDINGNHYICNGEMDEQAFYRLHYETQRIFTIRWSERFSLKNIVNIEGLEIEK